MSQSHPFQSISEAEWRAGKSRHQCAVCDRDYGDDLHHQSQSSWPVVVIIEDCYVPEYAPQIIQMVNDAGLDTAYVTIKALAIYAEFQLRGGRLN